MRIKTKLAKNLAILLLSVPLLGLAGDYFTIHKSDYLSQILYDLGLKPLYGKKGTIAQTLALNPELKKAKGNKLFPGQKILLPRTVVVAEVVAEKIPEIVEPPKIPEREISVDSSEDAAALLSISPGVDFFKIKGIDKTTKDDSYILSEASPTLNLAYSLIWDQLTTFAVGFKIQKYKLQELNSDRSYSDDSGNKVDLSLQVMRSLSECWLVGAALAFEQDLFFHANSETELGVDKVLITKPELLFRYIALVKSNANAGIDGKIGYNLGTKTDDYTIESGSHGGLGTYFKYHSKLLNEDYKSLEARLFYSVNNQDTSVTTKKLTNLSFMLTYDWRLPW